MSTNEVNFTLQELWEYELFPVGDFESMPVTVTKGMAFEEYPDIIRVCDVDSPEIMYNEYLNFISSVKTSPSRFVKERLKQLKLSVKDWAAYFKELGFNDKEYETYSMRVYGTTELREEIGPKTQEFIKSLGVKTFRQQYAVAHPGWKTKVHIDTNRLDLHGFRLMIPLNTTFSIGFDSGVYELCVGGAYFVNVTKPHYGINSQNEKRCNIMLHLSSDSLLNFDNAMKPN